MKKFILFTMVTAISVASFAQGKSAEHGHGKGKDKEQKEWNKKGGDNDRDEVYNNGTNYNNGHQPKKIYAALLRDYPNARNVSWSKYKGDYTATFNNGPWRSTAVYHANGERRDTRTTLTRQQLPGTIWDRIFQRDNVIPASYIQIEQPTVAERIYRVLSGNNTAYYYDANGNRVQYNY